MRKITLITSLTALCLVQLSAQVSQPYKIDFENRPVGAYTMEMVKTDFPNASWYHGFEYERASTVVDDGNKTLRVKYPKGCLGPNYEEGCGIQIKWNLPETAKTMWIQYRIKFEVGFDFRKGGKLPGLCGGKAYSGGGKPSKGDGWSARIMWREDGAIYQYMYYVDQQANYGDYWAWNNKYSETCRFIPGKWHTVTTQIILNTVNSGATTGNHNGELHSWLDGEKVLEKKGLRFVDYEDQMIDIFYFSTFHGGDNNDWRPLNDSYIRFDDIIVSNKPIDIDPSNNSTVCTQEEIIIVYPDPTNQLIIQAEKEILMVEIFSVLGERLIKTEQTLVNIQTLSPGIYFVQATFSDNKKATAKFLKR